MRTRGPAIEQRLLHTLQTYGPCSRTDLFLRKVGSQRGITLALERLRARGVVTSRLCTPVYGYPIRVWRAHG